MDSKLGYTLRTKGKNIYLSDTLIQLQKEMNDENLLKEYVFKREDVPENERLIYKLDYLADNMDGIIDTRKNKLSRYDKNVYASRRYCAKARRICKTKIIHNS